MTSFFRFASKRVIYRLGIISLAHAPVHVSDFPVVNVHVDELSSARIWQHKLCATYSASVNINNRLPIKVYYRICTLRHIRIEIIHGNQNVFWVLTWIGRYEYFIPNQKWGVYNIYYYLPKIEGGKINLSPFFALYLWKNLVYLLVCKHTYCPIS